MSEDYSQPNFYKFNQDSLRLVSFVRERLSHAHSILDLGAGSGVIGIELSRKLDTKSLTMLEVQQDYEKHLYTNIARFSPLGLSTQVLIQSFKDFHPTTRFDLIVCNPPYYLPGRGELSADPKRALARSFIQDTWEILLGKVDQSLSDEGRCFFVLKQDEFLFEYIKKQLPKNLGLNKFLENELMFLELFRLNKN